MIDLSDDVDMGMTKLDALLMLAVSPPGLCVLLWLAVVAMLILLDARAGRKP